jgi:hypothetical protein
MSYMRAKPLTTVTGTEYVLYIDSAELDAILSILEKPGTLECLTNEAFILYTTLKDAKDQA